MVEILSFTVVGDVWRITVAWSGHSSIEVGRKGTTRPRHVLVLVCVDILPVPVLRIPRYMLFQEITRLKQGHHNIVSTVISATVILERSLANELEARPFLFFFNTCHNSLKGIRKVIVFRERQSVFFTFCLLPIQLTYELGVPFRV